MRSKPKKPPIIPPPPKRPVPPHQGHQPPHIPPRPIIPQPPKNMDKRLRPITKTISITSPKTNTCVQLILLISQNLLFRIVAEVGSAAV
jgi:hypothetical protein